jgi:hypothetical protein
MRSANALLELPQAPATMPAGTLVPALLIADLSGGLTAFLALCVFYFFFKIVATHRHKR